MLEKYACKIQLCFLKKLLIYDIVLSCVKWRERERERERERFAMIIWSTIWNGVLYFSSILMHGLVIRSLDLHNSDCNSFPRFTRIALYNRGNELQPERTSCVYVNRGNELQSGKTSCVNWMNELQGTSCVNRGNELLIRANELPIWRFGLLFMKIRMSSGSVQGFLHTLIKCCYSLYILKIMAMWF